MDSLLRLDTNGPSQDLKGEIHKVRQKKATHSKFKGKMENLEEDDLIEKTKNKLIKSNVDKNDRSLREGSSEELPETLPVSNANGMLQTPLQESQNITSKNGGGLHRNESIAHNDADLEGSAIDENRRQNKTSK